MQFLTYIFDTYHNHKHDQLIDASEVLLPYEQYLKHGTVPIFQSMA